MGLIYTKQNPVQRRSGEGVWWSRSKDIARQVLPGIVYACESQVVQASVNLSKCVPPNSAYHGSCCVHKWSVQLQPPCAHLDLAHDQLDLLRQGKSPVVLEVLHRRSS